MIYRTVQKLGLTGFALVAIAAGETGIQREGPFWVEVERGSASVSRSSRLEIFSVGGVTVKGTPGNQVMFTLTKRVRAGSQVEARRLLNGLHARTGIKLNFITLTILGSSGMADLEVRAPSTFHDVVVRTRGGPVVASGFDGTVRAETGAGRVNLDRISGSVNARTAGGDILLGQITGSVHCTSGGGPIQAGTIGGEAFFETRGGDITVQEVKGPVRCSTAGGGIRIVQAGNVVIADTAGGPIDVGYAKGMVTAKNSGGPIQVGGASGAQCESAGGGIRLQNITGSLKASTAVGSIIAHFQSQPASDSFLSTEAGDITIWIPSNLKMTIRAQNVTYGGKKRIVTDFPAILVKAVGPNAVAEGELNGGGPLVRIAASGGTIYIRREAK
ncbi:MAG: hypothetical protein DMG57_26445 [Acidobacteria bacterium]|nr:MAG: hypothetical protein DMG57_26445 [Acidobacteriota bacterium]